MRSMCKMCIFVKKFATNENRADSTCTLWHVGQKMSGTTFSGRSLPRIVGGRSPGSWAVAPQDHIVPAHARPRPWGVRETVPKYAMSFI
jgi:hypothetical protein